MDPMEAGWRLAARGHPLPQHPRLHQPRLLL